MKILVADDLGVIRSIIRKAVKEHGVDVIDEAKDGAEAWQMIQDNTYHLIIIDWVMPKMDGLEVVTKARKLGIKCPIIMQTTNNTRNNVMEAIQAGVNDYILKPFCTADVHEKVEKYIVQVAMLGH